MNKLKGFQAKPKGFLQRISSLDSPKMRMGS